MSRPLSGHRGTLDILVTVRHLEAQGLHPTPRMVRLALGGGNPTAIAQTMAAASVMPVETLIDRRRDELENEILAARHHLAELEAELARVEELAATLPPLPEHTPSGGA